MSEEEIIELIREKIKNDDKKVIITFYEMKVKRNLENKVLFDTLHIISEELNSLDYKVYRTNQKYHYKNKDCIVESNELMVGIK